MRAHFLNHSDPLPPFIKDYNMPTSDSDCEIEEK